ncbi:MAG: YwaF family protein [Acidimicrobiales bacterium]
MTAVVTPVAYATAVGLGAALVALACIEARRHPGPWRVVAAAGLGLVLLGVAASYVGAEVSAGTFSARTDLPLALCDVAVLVGGAACLTRAPLLVELTYFWGLAGTLQAVVTPDLDVGFPHLVFFQYVVGHVGIVAAALFLVVGMGQVPRRGAVVRVIVVTGAYSAVVGLVDATTGANYMFLRRPPSNWTLLRLLGPWPWYTVSAAAVAVVLFVLLDTPFRLAR